MSNPVKRVKIIITSSENAKMLLQYIDKHIHEIRASGFYIKIEKISRANMDAEMVEILRKNNIPRLPAMKLPGGKCYIGNNNIIAMLSKRAKLVQSQGIISAPTSVESFMERELWEGTDEEGKKIARKDSDGENTDKNDIDRKMAMYQPPKHYVEPTNRLNDIARNNEREPHQPDNVSSPHILQNPLPLNGDADDDMMSKWMQNNMTDEY
jgi:hypothetical protein